MREAAIHISAAHSSLPTEMVNDKGRYRQSRQRRLGCHLAAVAGDRNPKTIIDNILQLLFAPDVSLRCLNGSVPEQKPDLFEFATAIVTEPSTCTSKIVGRQMLDALPGTPLDGYHTTFAVTPASCSFPNLETLLNIRPSLTPECRSQASTSCLDHAGTGTVRSRLPLPIRSTITHRPSRVCS